MVVLLFLMFKKVFTTALAIFFFTATFSQTKVYLIPTLHGLHKTNEKYNYDSLRSIIGRSHPDVIAVEIRAEDVKEDTAYIKKNYPYEMWMMRYWFPSTMIEGFDWLGTELEGKHMPDNYWRNQSRIKALERLLDMDTVYSNRLKRCRIYTDDRLAILKTQPLAGILKSSDAILTKLYYDCMNLQLRGSNYEELTDFYTTRNKMMQERLQGLTEQHQGKTIVILTGDDHYPYLLESLRKQKLIIAQPY